jgi:hypothetical protein
MAAPPSMLRGGFGGLVGAVEGVARRAGRRPLLLAGEDFVEKGQGVGQEAQDLRIARSKAWPATATCPLKATGRERRIEKIPKSM